MGVYCQNTPELAEMEGESGIDLQKNRLTVRTCHGGSSLPAALARARNRITEQVNGVMAVAQAATVGPSGALAPRPLVWKQ